MRLIIVILLVVLAVYVYNRKAGRVEIETLPAFEPAKDITLPTVGHGMLKANEANLNSKPPRFYGVKLLLPGGQIIADVGVIRGNIVSFDGHVKFTTLMAP